MNQSDEAQRRDTSLDDEVSLARAAAEGDPVAQKRLAAAVIDGIRGTLSYISSNTSDVDDLTQLALIQVLKSAKNFRGESSLSYWSDRIAVRTAAKCFEKRRRRDDLFTKFFLRKEQGPSLEEQIDKSQARQRLAVLLEQIYYKNRTALILKYVKGYSIDEISNLLNCKKNTVRGLLRRGKQQLKKSIQADPVLTDWLERMA